MISFRGDAKDEKLSQVHLELDEDKLKTMSKPYDFKKNLIATQPIETFKQENYITSASMVNTIYKRFGAPETPYKIKIRRVIPLSAAEINPEHELDVGFSK